MNASSHDQATRIFERWHETIVQRDAQGLANLYSPDAIFESPAVWTLTAGRTGILKGRTAISDYFETFFAKLDRGAADWYRSGRFFFDGRELTWEYPRQTPSGDQTDLVEWMDLADGLIAHHRVYWGWIGVKNLSAARTDPHVVE